jgi:hypothetical protein
LWKEVIVIYCENDKKQEITLFGDNKGFLLNVTARGKNAYQRVLNAV